MFMMGSTMVAIRQTLERHCSPPRRGLQRLPAALRPTQQRERELITEKNGLFGSKERLFFLLPAIGVGVHCDTAGTAVAGGGVGRAAASVGEACKDKE